MKGFEQMSEAEACKFCRKPLSERKIRRHALYCDRICSRNFVKKQYASLNGRDGTVSRATVGAVSELIVSVDLLRRGYDVFRALSPSCSCDLVILKNGRVIRVEVRTGVINTGGKIAHAWKEKDRDRSDVLAVVVNGSIIYKPELA